jgi:Xaa-Pro aminopeptidase
MNEIEELQKLLKEKHLSYYIVPTDDDHQSEMVGDFYQFRAYLSHFTGSAGTLLVSPTEAWLWTDGRYFIQAEEQLPDNVTLMKSRMPNVPTLTEFLVENMEENDVLGFDASVMNASFILDLEESLDFDLKFEDVDLTEIWRDRPERSHEPVFLYDDKYNGKNFALKLEWLRDYMDANAVDHHLIASLDDIAWIFNIRGNDIACTPVALAFAIIDLDKAYLYLQKGTYDQKIIDHFEEKNVFIKDYEDIYPDVASLEGSLLVDLEAVNYKLFTNIHCEFYDETNPSQYFKAIKNETEIKNTTYAHIKDGVAVTKFMYWLKHNINKGHHTEISISNKLEEFRKAMEHYVEPSFETICAYKENGAIIHYKPDETHNAEVKPEGLLMIDSGGQYLEGTTDITRTFVLGKITPEEKRDFTLVLKCWLNLMNIVFPYGMTGVNLDTVARAPLWEYGLDFRHGTGHGVGHFLSCHEGPQAFRPYDDESARIEPGMITSDEPGVYIEGSHGIRHENLLLCVKSEISEYGQFLKFVPLTMVPIDLDGVDESLLSPKQLKELNDYHKQVYDTIGQYLTDEERAWLKGFIKE